MVKLGMHGCFPPHIDPEELKKLETKGLTLCYIRTESIQDALGKELIVGVTDADIARLWRKHFRSHGRIVVCDKYIYPYDADSEDHPRLNPQRISSHTSFNHILVAVSREAIRQRDQVERFLGELGERCCLGTWPWDRYATRFPRVRFSGAPLQPAY